MLIPGACKCYLIKKKGLAVVINLKILIWGDDPRLCKRALNPIANVLIKERQGRDATKEEKAM